MKHISKLGVLLLAVIMLISAFTLTASADTPSLPDKTTARVLNITKYSPVPENGTAGTGTAIAGAPTGSTALPNVEFEVYKVPSNQATSATPSADEITAIKITANLKNTMVTNNSGLATWTITPASADPGVDASANDGIYLVVEKTNPAVTNPAAPFYVSIPMTNESEDGFLYTVNVYPKNDVPTPPTISKDVDSLGTKSATHGIQENETWIVRATLPADLYRTVSDGAGGSTKVYSTYSITDAFTGNLTYRGNLQVKIVGKDGIEQTTALIPTTHYSLTQPSIGTDGGTIIVSLTDAGKEYVQGALDAITTGTGTPELRIYFDTSINYKASLATAIPNGATLNYTNSLGISTQVVIPDNERPEVHTGGLVIQKKDSSSNAVLGLATFKIYRDATQAEIDARTGVENIKVTAGETTEEKAVVAVQFYDCAMPDTAGTHTAASTVTTNNADPNKGRAYISGLAYGTYYLVETQAPDGYNLLASPMTVTVGENTHTASVEVLNSAKFVLPITGGSGTMLFTMGGIVLIGLAVILLVVSRKNKHTAE